MKLNKNYRYFIFTLIRILMFTSWVDLIISLLNLNFLMYTNPLIG